MMTPPVTGRSTSKLGTPMIRLAKIMAKQAQMANSASRHRILNGFLLRAIRSGNTYQGQVIDIPAFFSLMSGAPERGLDKNPNPSANAGVRDQFTSGAKVGPVTISTAEIYIPDPLRKDLPDQVTVALYYRQQWLWHDSLFSTSMMAFAMKGSSFPDYPLDELQNFTYSEPVQVVSNAINFKISATTEQGVVRNNFWATTTLCVSESDMPVGWAMSPRRLVERSAYRESDDYFAELRLLRMCAADYRLVGEDYSSVEYCSAFSAYNQYRGTFFTDSPESGYRPLRYDRDCDRALAIAIGRREVASFDPEAGRDGAWVPIESIVLVRAQDVPYPDMRPFPAEDPANEYGKPATPIGADFNNPFIVETTEGFTSFCNYVAGSARREGPLRSIRSVLVIAPDETVHVLEASSDEFYRDEQGNLPAPPDFPGYEQDIYREPWIVGAFSVESVDDQGRKLKTGYALVNEVVRQQTGLQSDGYLLGSAIWDVQMSLYVYESGEPVRQILDGPGVAVFSVWAARSHTFPYQQVLKGEKYVDVSLLERASSFCWIGGNFAAVPVVEKPMPIARWYSEIGEAFVTPDVAAHEVKCQVVNLETGETEIRGTIFTRTMAYTTCFVSMVQPYSPPTEQGGQPVEAVLLATESAPAEAGYEPGIGYLHLSTDGGRTWARLNRDAELGPVGRIGTHYVGNSLWDYNPGELFSEKLI